jgi:hypothetical protein
MNERVKIPRHQIADLIELSGRPFQSETTPIKLGHTDGCIDLNQPSRTSASYTDVERE